MSQDTSRETPKDRGPQDQNDKADPGAGQVKDTKSENLYLLAVWQYRALYSELEVRVEDFSPDAKLRIAEFMHQRPRHFVREGLRSKVLSFLYDDELEEYLQNPANSKLYAAESADIWRHFDKLEFFKILDAQARFISEHWWRPLIVRRRLIEIPLNDHQKYFLISALETRFTELAEKDSRFTPALDIIRVELEIYDFRVFREERMAELKRFHREDVGLLRDHLGTLTSVREKLAYLIGLRTDFLCSLQRVSSNSVDDGAEQPFVRQIDLEIERYQRLLELEQGTAGVGAEDPGKARVRDVGPKVLALDYLLRHVQAQGDKKNTWAPFVAFITGSTPGHVRPYLSNPYAPSERKPELWKQNMLQLRQFFSQMGLDEIVREIDRDISYFGAGAGSKKKVSYE